MVVEEQAKTHEPCRAILRAVWQNKTHRPDDMRCGVQQNFALDQSFAHKTEFVIFEVTQAAMHKFTGARRGAFREIVFFR
ncbi:hypothetical protein D3C80_1391690 [compost metagenome]